MFISAVNWEVRKKKNMDIRIKKLLDNAVIPTQGTPGSAGYDLYAAQGMGIQAGETVAIDTGLAMAIPDGYFGAVFARSGLSKNEGLRPCNCVGVIDPSYRGSIIVALHNDSKFDRVVKIGERIAQLVILPYSEVRFFETNDLGTTERGEGGFGSTGV